MLHALAKEDIMRNILLWGTIPMLFILLQGVRIGVGYHTAKRDCEVFKEPKSFMVCARKKRIAERSMRRFWDGH